MKNESDQVGYSVNRRVSQKPKKSSRQALMVQVVCSACGGTGLDDPPPGKYYGLCPECKGIGKISNAP